MRIASAAIVACIVGIQGGVHAFSVNRHAAHQGSKGLSRTQSLSATVNGDMQTSTPSVDEGAEAVVEAVADAIEAATDPDPVGDSELRASLITDLLRTAAASDRGQFATNAQKGGVDAVITQLEALNPTLRPAESRSIEGRWELLYSSTQLFRSSPFFMAGRAVCETEDQARQYDWFCDMHRAALAISTIGKVRQIVSSDRITSEFEVKVGAIPFLSDFTPLKYSGGLPFTIDGAIVSTADITPDASYGDSWEIFMDTVSIRGSNVPLLRQALDAGLQLKSRDLGRFLEDNVSGYSNPRPVFRTTYLDGKIRISRDQDGKVFVYGKVSDDTEPTDYSGVDSDLGMLKLLEGFNDSITKFYI